MRKYLLIITVLLFIPLITFTNTTKWKNAKSMPKALYGHSAISGSGEIYVVGGFSLKTRKCQKALYAYYPLTSTWKKLSFMSKARGFAGAAFVGSKIYVIGGNNMSRTLNYVEIYDTTTGAWSYGAPMPTPRRGFAVAVRSGKIYCIGGYNTNTRETLKTAEVYDTKRNKWRKLPDLPFRRQGAAAVAAGNKIYVIGGVIGRARSSRGPVFLRDVNYYNVKQRRWKKGPSLIYDRYYLSAVVHKGKIFAIGGIKGLRPVNVVETLSLSSGGRWLSRTDLKLNTPRNALACTKLNGAIYSIGGLGYNGDLNTVEVLRTN